jgi:hypothetical protein
VRRRVAALIRRVEEAAREKHRLANSKPMGKTKILAQHPHSKPLTSKRSKAPLCHESSLEKWIEYKETYRAFVDAFRRAADKLKRAAEDRIDPRTIRFPPGSFPPGLPYVPHPEAADPG